MVEEYTGNKRNKKIKTMCQLQVGLIGLQWMNSLVRRERLFLAKRLA